MYRRAYVRATVSFDEEGAALPLWIEYRGRKLTVDKVLDRRQAAATRAGGQGLRYTVRILGKQTYLFWDENRRWFVEAESGEA